MAKVLKVVPCFLKMTYLLRMTCLLRVMCLLRMMFLSDDGTLAEDDGTLEDCENDSPNCSISVTKRGRLLPVTRRYRPNKLIMKHLSSAKSNKDCLGHFLLCPICAFFIRSHETIEKGVRTLPKNDFLIICRLHVDLSPSTAVGKFRFDIFHQQCVKARTTPANILIFFVSLTQFSIHSKGHDLEWKEIHEGPNICCFLWEKNISIYASGRSPKMTASF